MHVAPLQQAGRCQEREGWESDLHLVIEKLACNDVGNDQAADIAFETETDWQPLARCTHLICRSPDRFLTTAAQAELDAAT